MFFYNKKQNVGVQKMSLESAITNVRNEFEEILKYVCNPDDRQIHSVERGIFQRLLKIGLALLMIFIKNYTSQKVSKNHCDRINTKRKFHSFKRRSYLSIFGKIEICRPYFWTESVGGVFPLDAELNLPDSEYSYLLQEWGTCLAVEQPYAKAAQFLEKFLKIPLWDSALEEILIKSGANIQIFYKGLACSAEENQLLVATVDCKGVLMRKSELEKKETAPKYRRMMKRGERLSKSIENVEIKMGLKDGKKKMACVTAVYGVDRNVRTVETVLAKHHQKENQKSPQQPRSRDKIVYGTLDGKQAAFEQLKTEISRRPCSSNAKRIALVDGEAKLTELLGIYLPGFEIIRDIVHVKEYLWDAAHIFYSEGTKEAENWVSEQFEKLLRGQVNNLIAELNVLCQKFKRSKTKRKEMNRVITYLENGKEYMKYDHYLAEGYQIGSGVIEGTCKNLVNDRCEHSGMHWTKKGANAMLSLRSIHINNLSENYWYFQIEQEKRRLYGSIVEVIEKEQLAA